MCGQSKIDLGIMILSFFVEPCSFVTCSEKPRNESVPLLGSRNRYTDAVQGVKCVHSAIDFGKLALWAV